MWTNRREEDCGNRGMDKTSACGKRVRGRASGRRDDEAVRLDDGEKFIIVVQFEVGNPWRWTSIDDNFVEDVELFRFEVVVGPFDGSVDGACKSHSHVCSVTIGQTSFEVVMHVLVFKIC